MKADDGDDRDIFPNRGDSEATFVAVNADVVWGKEEVKFKTNRNLLRRRKAQSFLGLLLRGGFRFLVGRRSWLIWSATLLAGKLVPSRNLF